MHALLSVVMLSTNRDLILLHLSLNGRATPCSGNTRNQYIEYRYNS